MPLTLYGYVLREMLKLLATTTAVLVLLMSFGFLIKPLSEGLLGPVQILRVLFYTMPIMLTSALPFAAAFSSTLVFFRLSADNEVMACAASGISYRELLMPVVTLGLLMTLFLFVMSNWVVPGFWQLVSREIEQDVAQVVLQKIARREVMKFGRVIIYADAAEDRVPIEQREPGVLRPYNRLVLDGVAVGRTSATEDKVIADYTADRAVVDLYRDPARDLSYLTMMLTNVSVHEPGNDSVNNLSFIERLQIDPQEIPTFFTQRPKFMSLPRLRQVAAEPERSPEVRDAKRKLAVTLADRELLEKLAARLNAGELVLDGPSGEQYLVRSPLVKADGSTLRLSGDRQQKVEVRIRDRGLINQRMEAASGEVTIVIDQLSIEPRLNMDLHNVAVIDAALPRPGMLRDRSLRLLRFSDAVLQPLESASIDRLLTEARGSDSERVMEAAKYLTGRIDDLVRNIASQLHSRAAIAVNCVLVLTLGAVMSMLMRGRVPLAIFFWCFVPTVLAFLTINSGQNMMESDKVNLMAGVAMTWGGNAGLLGMILLVYARLCRN